ncbi:MAG TPA: hypothetical protein VMN79_00045 [Casimicrobiaceae bacterium]|nr:hypothetical protein [Casimicrobiaceae bacterium]
MSTIIKSTFAAAVLASAALSSPPGFGGQRENNNISSVEIAQLPRFCWAQMEIPGADGPDFHILNCGPGANHYCTGLLYMIRAKGHVPKSTRFDLLGHADTDIKYTEKAIKDWPSCSIRDHVAESRVEVDKLMAMFGYNGRRAK